MKRAAALFFLCLPMALFGQNTDKPPLNYYDYALHLKPLALIDPSEQSIALGLEKTIAKNKSIGLDVAYIFGSHYYSNITNHISGYILQPFYRTYFHASRVGRSFAQFDLFYKHVNYSVTDWVNRDVQNGIAAYTQFMDFNIKKDIGAINAKIGHQSELFNNPNLMIEIYFGLGLRMNYQNVYNLPPNSTARTSTDYIFILPQHFGNSYLSPNLTFGFYISYSFSRKIKPSPNPE